MVARQDCIRCGECCKLAPCTYGRIRHTIAIGKPCPDLRLNADNTYSCWLIEHSPTVAVELIGTGCHWPEYRKEEKICKR